MMCGGGGGRKRQGGSEDGKEDRMKVKMEKKKKMGCRWRKIQRFYGRGKEKKRE